MTYGCTPRRKLKDLKGIRSGKLLILSFSHLRNSNSYWLCRCDCGTEKPMWGSQVKSGRITSCGCANEPARLKAIRKHMESCDRMTREYAAWLGMKARCYYPKHIGFKNYGGRGIKMEQEWLISYESFLKDMGRRPGPEYSLDRIDNDKNYGPTNCRWATRKEQMNNRRNSANVTVDGVTKHIQEWAKELNVTPECIAYRIKSGWSLEDAVKVPAKRLNRKAA